MLSTLPNTYDDAIHLLNTLQSAPIARTDPPPSIKSAEHPRSLAAMRHWLSLLGYAPSDLDRLNIIHVTGTKGKGSTCAFVSSILTSYYQANSRRASIAATSSTRKIGLYTSPHLRTVRERIRINNKPIAKDLFTHYFFQLYPILSSCSPRPGYFRFLTLLAFHVFLCEGVDTAIFEVGIGGENDSTNIVETPVVCGITRLGWDHVAVLGGNREGIAWQKSGIMKKGVVCCTVEQGEESLAVIRARAEEKGATLNIVRDELEGVNLGLRGAFQKENAALALAMVNTYLQQRGLGGWRNDEPLPEVLTMGLENVQLAGRCQILKDEAVTWYIDGAHTPESLKEAGTWFAEEMICSSTVLSSPSSEISESSFTPRKRVLIFNQQNRTAPEELLRILACSIQESSGSLCDHAIFCTNVTYRGKAYAPELVSTKTDKEAVKSLTVQRQLETAWKAIAGADADTDVAGTVEEALNIVKNLGGDGADVFVTGSLHLVGGLLELLDWQME